MAKKQINPEDLIDLPADIRQEIIADGRMETPRQADSPATPRPPRSRRDDTPTDCLCITHTMPTGEVFTELADEWGDPELDDQGKPKVVLITRKLERKERVSMPRWCAELMAGKDQIVLI